ncbi:uncharacterized protein LOC120249680 [Dioscorea cayenensis subsp. rotundata]|uniref:Uncharacterized protein LOC120249680 n=1 Tax=Dioscorea cayennensis subsp. rotundata TaxID=55577 RepID=A0AB40AH84_DIOCR|nr:uncharacterized protein LOC120249680 [Dioscorea cayenensis subsp. rotundata]
MNQLMKFAVFGPQKTSSCSSLGAVSLFHSTSVCERKRRTRWDSAFGNFSSRRFNNYSKRMRKMESKRTLLCNISNYAEHLFQSWRDDQYNWFQKQYGSKGANKDGSAAFRWGTYRNKRKGGIEFCTSDDDDDAETIFRSAFGGEGFFHWSFTNTENFSRRNSSNSGNWRFSWEWSYQTDDENETDGEISTQVPELASERRVLGLSPSGPLKIEEVKSAYRACALRWHPDRHQGSSKVAAEERFKRCSNAYKLLCDNLTAS